MSASRTATPWRPPSPKLQGARRGWYRYYAGYSSEFVREVLAHLRLRKGATILDPWNGSGTTTAAAIEDGYDAIGFDANPALVLVALGRQLEAGTAPSLSALTNDLLNHAKEDAQTSGGEPLKAWFEPETAARLRALERAIQRTLVDEKAPKLVAERGLQNISTLAAFFYVALFEVTRSLVAPFRTSNPTWVKAGGDAANLVARSWEDLDKALRDAVGHLTPAPRATAPDRPGTLAVASSLKLPVDPEVVEATVTSPPYCTRIDYVMATLPELAVLGYDRPQVRDLRNAMVGTPTMWSQAAAKSDDAWGDGAINLLEKVAHHPSRASSTYYLKYLTQYFQSIWHSLGEIERVSKPNAPLVLVAQDSYYKEIHIDLPAILEEMVRSRGWRRVERVDFPTSVTKAAIHPGARKYRTAFGAVERVLICRS